MHVLVFRHVPFEHLGRIADALHRHSIEPVYIDLPTAPETRVAIRDAAGAIFMGGPMSVNDGLPYLQQELRYAAQCMAYRKPLLGVCLGAQLIAKALGARVYRNPIKEIGWFPVNFTDFAAADPLFAGIGPQETVFHWHGETFDLPETAQLLASSPVCRNQAFRVGLNVYGLQFHLEVTPEMIADWLQEDANCGDLRELSVPLDPHACAARLKDLAQVVFDRWCALLND